jgi:hypothetical protein
MGTNRKPIPEWVLSLSVIVIVLMFVFLTYHWRPDVRAMESSKSANAKIDEVLERLDRIEKRLE